jgi:hypothetical protein
VGGGEDSGSTGMHGKQQQGVIRQGWGPGGQVCTVAGRWCKVHAPEMTTALTSQPKYLLRHGLMPQCSSITWYGRQCMEQSQVGCTAALPDAVLVAAGVDGGAR